MKTINRYIIQLVGLFIFSTAIAQPEIISEDLLLMNDSIQLPGTLTLNKTLEKQPLVIFVQGSGNPDRNGNQPAFGVNINYIKLLRDKLNENGIAFYSYDKRNVTKSNIKFIMQAFNFDDLVNDVEVAINKFKNDSRFNSITLIGHSQGSLIAMLAINKHIDKYISLAGLGESVDKALTRQITAQSAPLGEKTEAYFKELRETGTIKDVDPLLASIFAKVNLPFLESYTKYDPTEELRKITVPTLIINGEKDIQVLVSDAKSLHNAKPDSKLVLLSKMNHVLKDIEEDSDNLVSYTSPDFPLSMELVDAITQFVKQ